VPAMATADVLREIVTAIAPFIGENMARSATQVHCQKLGIADATHLTPAQLGQLITRLETGLRVFMGRDGASSLMSPLRARFGVAA